MGKPQLSVIINYDYIDQSLNSDLQDEESAIKICLITYMGIFSDIPELANNIKEFCSAPHRLENGISRFIFKFRSPFVSEQQYEIVEDLYKRNGCALHSIIEAKQIIGTDFYDKLMSEVGEWLYEKGLQVSLYFTNYDDLVLEVFETKSYNIDLDDPIEVLKSVLKNTFNLDFKTAELISSKVAVAAKIEKLRSELEWPPAKIEFYQDREPLPETGRKETAIEFYNRVWKTYADAWLISQEILKNKFGEDKLVPALRSQCQREKLEFSSHSPPSQNKLNDSLATLDLGGMSEKLISEHRARTAANKAIPHSNT